MAGGAMAVLAVLIGYMATRVGQLTTRDTILGVTAVVGLVVLGVVSLL